MKQNKLTIIFFSLLVALAFTACNDDLLEKHPLDEVSSADFFKQNKKSIRRNRFRFAT